MLLDWNIWYNVKLRLSRNKKRDRSLFICKIQTHRHNRVLWLNFQHYPMTCKSQGSLSCPHTSFTGFVMYPTDAAFEPTLRREAFLVFYAPLNHFTSADLASHLRLQPLRNFPDYIYQFATDRCPAFFIRNRHFITHRWDRLLLLLTLELNQVSMVYYTIALPMS